LREGRAARRSREAEPGIVGDAIGNGQADLKSGPDVKRSPA
jgi:hypothetical protein